MVFRDDDDDDYRYGNDDDDDYGADDDSPSGKKSPFAPRSSSSSPLTRRASDYDDEDDEDEDDSTSKKSSFGGNRPSPFTGGSSSASSFGVNRPPSSGGSTPSSGGLPGGNRPFGGGGSSGSGNPPSSGGNRPFSSGGGSSGSGNPPSSGGGIGGGNRPFSGGSSGSGNPPSSGGGNRPFSSGGGSSGSGNPPSSGGGNRPFSSGGSSGSGNPPSSGGGNRPFSSGGGSSGSGDKKDDKPAGGGGMLGRFGSGDKKDDKPAGGGGMLGRFGSGDKKDDKPAGGGGVLGRFGSGDKKDDKKDDKPAGGGGVLGRFGSGDKKDDKKDDKPAGGGLGGFFNRGGDKKDDKKNPPPVVAQSAFGNSASASSSSTSSPTNRYGAGGSATTTGSNSPPKANAAKLEKASTTKKDSGGGGGFLSKLFGRGGNEQQAARPAARSKSSATPVVETGEGLTLDNWLDIIGVALLLSSLMLFFSALSAEQAAIRGLHLFLGQLLGWGALAVPLLMFMIGAWLIVRHFGDKAPTIDPIRLGGAALAFVSVLIIFQYIDSFSYIAVTNIDLLRLRLDFSWRVEQAGGGAIGASLYYALVTNVTEIGGVFVLVFMALIAVMLLTRSSASQMVGLVVGMWRNTRASMKQRAIAKRAERQLQTLQQNQSAAPVPVLSALATAAPDPLQEAVVLDVSDRSIRFNRGGEVLQQPATVAPVVAQTVSQPAAPVYAPPAPAQQPTPATGGVLGRLRTGAPNEQPQQGTGGIGGLFRMGGGRTPATNSTAEPLPPPLPFVPLPMDDEPIVTIKPSATVVTPAPETPSVPIAPPAETVVRPPQPAPEEEVPSRSAANPFAVLDEAEKDEEPLRRPSITDEPASPFAQRAERLNQLRSGQTQAPMTRDLTDTSFTPQQKPIDLSTPAPAQQPAASITPERKPDEMPERAPTQTPAFGGQTTPASQLPSAQMTTQPAQQSLNIPVASPVYTNRPLRTNWKAPDYRTLLSSGSEQEFDQHELLRQAKIIEETLASFGAPGRVVEVNTGPVITQFGIEPDYIMGRNNKKQRVKVGTIATLDKDLQLALGAKSIRVEAPVPGKGYVGIEVPNAEAATVRLRDVMESPAFQKHKSPLAIALGQSVSGAPVSADLASMPHLLIAGTTGSGKSVCVNAVITSIVSRHTPETVKFIMVDPKRVELTGYNGIPHLVAPVVVELERIVGVLKWVTREMDERYKKFSDAGARNIEDYNKHRDPDVTENMPYIIVIIDELADLMMLAPEETERTITRIAALARATGIHLVIATQRPSVDVVTGLIKANFPARIAFAVAGGVDSRVILDQPGAERLLGRGDMLYLSGDSPAPQRLQGVFVSDIEINNIVRYWKMQAVTVGQPEPRPLTSFVPSAAAEQGVKDVMPRGERVRQQAFWDSVPKTPADGLEEDDEDFGDDILSEDVLTGDDGGEDELYEQSVELVRRLDKASVSLLQRRLRIGYTRAARLIDVMEARGVIGPAKDGSSKPRDVLPQR